MVACLPVILLPYLFRSLSSGADTLWHNDGEWSYGRAIGRGKFLPVVGWIVSSNCHNWHWCLLECSERPGSSGIIGYLTMKELAPANPILVFCYLFEGCGHLLKGGKVYHLDLPSMKQILVDPKCQLWVGLVVLHHPLAEVPYSVAKEFTHPGLGCLLRWLLSSPCLPQFGQQLSRMSWICAVYICVAQTPIDCFDSHSWKPSGLCLSTLDNASQFTSSLSS